MRFLELTIPQERRDDCRVSNTRKPVASLRQQSAWILTAKVVGFCFSFVLPIVIVRYLDPEEVGNYRKAFLVITNAMVILPLGFSMSAYYFLARDSDRRRAAILNILLFNFVVGGLGCFTLALFPQVLGHLFQSDEMTRLAPKIGVVIWIWIFSTFLETVAIANQEARIATLFIILAQFSKALLMAAAVFAFSTVEAFIWAAMVQGVIQTAVLLWYLRSRFPRFWTAWNGRFFLEQSAYAIPFGLTAILWIAQTDIHNYFVGYKFSSSEFAIYAYGCFEIPLISMLVESVNAVLIPRMNALHMRGDRNEMVRLVVRAMQKLAFAYFPVYVFLWITGRTFIVTLFTEKYEQSTEIFLVNITLLPFSILITDAVIRSHKELGRVFLLIRILVLTCLVGVLCYGLQSFGMRGMIWTAVGAVVIEKLVAETIVIRKLGLGLRDLPLLKNVGKTAVAALVAGSLTYVVYASIVGYMPGLAERLAAEILGITRPGLLNLIGGVFVLAVCAAAFAPIYLLAANMLGLIEDEEKQTVRWLIRRFLSVRPQTVRQNV